MLCWWLTLRRWVCIYVGCVLMTHETACLDFRDRDLVRDIYYPEMAGVVRRLTGVDLAPGTIKSFYYHPVNLH